VRLPMPVIQASISGQSSSSQGERLTKPALQELTQARADSLFQLPPKELTQLPPPLNVDLLLNYCRRNHSSFSPQCLND
jgi:hypothetical protein